MGRKTPRPGKGAGRGTSSQSRLAYTARRLAQKQRRAAPTPALDLVGLRERLVGARRRLVERIAEDFPADRRFPDSGWTRMLADIQIAVDAVDAVMDEGGP